MSSPVEIPEPGLPRLQPAAATYVRPPKSPGLALFLSLFPGVGQIYNGQPAKAFVFLIGWAGSIWGAAEVSPFPFAFLIPFVYIYNLIDAYATSAQINARALGGMPAQETDTTESPAWGVTLVVLGLALLCHNLGWVRFEAVARYWPVLLIAAGAFFIFSSVQRRKGSETADGSAS
jgi:TM2 domain-containing membrane protein YozV